MKILRELIKPRGPVGSDLMVRRPFREGFLLTIIALGDALLVVDLGDFFAAAHERSFYAPLVGTVLAVGCIGFAYTFLGSRIGSRAAATIVKVVIAAIIVPVLVIFAVRSLMGL